MAKSEPAHTTATAAVLAIGNELLSGKVRDENLAYLAGELRQLGVELALAMLIPDDTQAIVDALDYARQRASIVLTCGGVGPTHDDITLAAVGAALERPLVQVPELLAAVEAYYGDAVNDEVRSMALAPEGVELLQPAKFFVPIFKVEQVYCFPGVPGALRLLFEAWKPSLATLLGASPYHSAQVRLDLDEGEVAPLLSAVQREFPEVDLGSYPRFDAERPYKVLVTLDGKDLTRVEAAFAALLERLHNDFGRERVVAHEGPAAPDR